MSHISRTRVFKFYIIVMIVIKKSPFPPLISLKCYLNMYNNIMHIVKVKQKLIMAQEGLAKGSSKRKLDTCRKKVKSTKDHGKGIKDFMIACK